MVAEGGYGKCKIICATKFKKHWWFWKWLHETEIWQCLTDPDKNKQGPTIYLSLDDRIGKMCSDIQVKDLHNDDGVEILITKLKSLFLRHKSSGIPYLWQIWIV